MPQHPPSSGPIHAGELDGFWSDKELEESPYKTADEFILASLKQYQEMQSKLAIMRSENMNYAAHHALYLKGWHMGMVRSYAMLSRLEEIREMLQGAFAYAMKQGEEYSATSQDGKELVLIRRYSMNGKRYMQKVAVITSGIDEWTDQRIDEEFDLMRERAGRDNWLGTVID